MALALRFTDSEDELLELEEDVDDCSSEDCDSAGNNDLGGSSFFVLISLSPLQVATSSDAIALLGALIRSSGQSMLSGFDVAEIDCLTCIAILALRIPSTCTA